MGLTRRGAIGLLASVSALPFTGLSNVQAEDAAPKRGGTLTFVAQGEPTTLVPLLDSNTRTRWISTKILEGLVRFDLRFEPQPVLATSWSLSDDGLRYTFNLREGVKWHDGADFTSADVRFSLLAFKKAGPRGHITFANVEDVETPDPHTAIILLTKPVPYLLKALTGGETPILPAHRYQGDKFAESPNGLAPVGTGPFVFVEWQRGSHVVLKRNDAYWQPGLPHLDRFVARFVGDSATASTALETGEADFSYDIGLPDIARLEQSPKLRVATYFDAYLNNAQILEFNLESQVLANAAVRHALAHAIDRSFINEAIFYGHAKAAASTIPAVFTAYNDEQPFTYPYDLKKAAAILDEAGFKPGPDGTRFSLRLAFLTGDLFKRTAEYLRGSFAKIGVKVQVIDGDLATYIRRVYMERGFDLNLNGISRLFDPIAGVQRLYWSENIAHPLPYANAAHYNNPAVDALFRQAAGETDEAKRAAEFKQIQAIVGPDLPAIAVVALPTIIASNARVHNLITTIDVGSSDLAEAWVE